jgi:hypothetical protein
MSELPISNLVKVDVNLGAAAAQAQSTSDQLVLTSETVIDTAERLRIFSSLTEVATTFGTAGGAYKAAQSWFAQTPTPSKLLIGRYAATDTNGLLVGGGLAIAQQGGTSWAGITNGSFAVSLDGNLPKNITGLSFAGTTNLNAVANIISAALTSLYPSATSGTQTVNVGGAVSGATTTGLVSGTTYTASILVDGVAKPVSTLGSAAATYTALLGVLNGAMGASAVASISGGNVLITSATTGLTSTIVITDGVTNPLFATLATFVSIGSAIHGDKVAGGSCTYDALGKRFIIQSTLQGINSSVGFATISTTSVGLDISALAGFTVGSSGSYVANGVAAETPLTATALFDDRFGQQWYSLFIDGIGNSDAVAVAGFIEGTTTKHVFACNSSEAGALVSGNTTDLGYLLSAAGYKKTIVQYDSDNAYAVLSLMAKHLSVDYTANKSVITGMYKQEPGNTAESLSLSQLTTLMAKHYNVFVKYNNNTAIVQEGKVASGEFIDVILGADWGAIDIQKELYNVLYTSTTKIPQTEEGHSILDTAIIKVSEQAVNNGLVAPGVWDQAGFGTLKQGDYLESGYYVYHNPVAEQSTSDRAARKSTTFQVAWKLAGAIHTVGVLFNINR